MLNLHMACLLRYAVQNLKSMVWWNIHFSNLEMYWMQWSSLVYCLLTWRTISIRLQLMYTFITQLMYKFITQYSVDFKSVFIKAKSSMKSTFQEAPKRLSHSGQSVIGLA